MKALEHLETLYLGCRQLVMKADDHEKAMTYYMAVKAAIESLAQQVLELEAKLAEKEASNVE